MLMHTSTIVATWLLYQFVVISMYVVICEMIFHKKCKCLQLYHSVPPLDQIEITKSS